MGTYLKAGIISALISTPFFAFAVELSAWVDTIGNLIGLATPIVVALALVVFFWGLVTYIFGLGGEESKKSSISIMVYGAIALFVMISISGIIGVLQDTFDVNQNTPLKPPKVEGVRGI